MDIPFDQLEDRIDSRGIGGFSPYYREEAILSFADSPHTRFYLVDLLIAEPHEGNEGLPSLLGRDIINHWAMNYDPTNDTLDFIVRHAGYSLDAT